MLVGAAGVILHSSDGGLGWTERSNGTRSFLFDIAFSDANVAISVGGNGTVLRTTNAGNSWSLQLFSLTGLFDPVSKKSGIRSSLPRM